MSDAAKTIDGTPEQPRYRQIYSLLRERIHEGRYPLGSNLPTEVELCAEFGVSRYTVREALRRLVDQGMLERRQGSGSAVIAAEPQSGFVHQVRSLADLFQYALDTYLEIQSIGKVVISSEVAESIGEEIGSRWLLIKAVRLTHESGSPICVTYSYIPERLAWIESEIPDCVGPFYALLEARAGEPVSEAVQEIKAEPMTRAIASGLRLRQGDYALRLLRRYSSRKGILVASFNWHPADSFAYRMQLQPNSER